MAEDLRRPEPFGEPETHIEMIRNQLGYTVEAGTYLDVSGLLDPGVYAKRDVEAFLLGLESLGSNDAIALWIDRNPL